MRRLLLLIVFASTAYLLIATSSRAQSGDAWVGSWTLNVAQSSYDPATLAPRSQTTAISTSGDTFTVVSDGVNAQGARTHDETTYKFDGKDYNVEGAPDATTTRTYTRVDAHHYSYATKVNGLITTTSRVAVTPDGKTRTITTTGRDAEGRAIRNFAVWVRQAL
jgi:hypothetical protein